MPERDSQLIGPLAAFADDTHSQFGEDGIIAEVLRRLGADQADEQRSRHQASTPGTKARLARWCVEFGAWDGLHLSNTARLVREDGYRAVLIEADVARAAQLEQAHPGGTVIAMQAMVGTQGATRLDALLSGTPVPPDFDLLSIDIDGNDYHVWQAVREYRPKVVVIEFNPTIPNAVHWVQPDDASVQQGASAAALVSLGKRKGYVPVAATYANLVFVAAEHAAVVLGDERPDLAELRNDADAQTYLFVGYDGTLHTSRPITLPWLGGTEVAEARIQPLPPALRGMYAGEGGRWARWRYRLAVAAADPAAYARRVRLRAARLGRRG